MNFQYPFKLSGKITEDWSKVTNSQWKKMLPKNWTDKGFHFYNRIKTRGPKAGIQTPSDFESYFTNGILSLDHGNRYKVRTTIINGNSEHLTFFYDYNKTKKQCELVTTSYEA